MFTLLRLAFSTAALQNLAESLRPFTLCIRSCLITLRTAGQRTATPYHGGSVPALEGDVLCRMFIPPCRAPGERDDATGAEHFASFQLYTRLAFGNVVY